MVEHFAQFHCKILEGGPACCSHSTMAQAQACLVSREIMYTIQDCSDGKEKGSSKDFGIHCHSDVTGTSERGTQQHDTETKDTGNRSRLYSKSVFKQTDRQIWQTLPRSRRRIGNQGKVRKQGVRQ